MLKNRFVPALVGVLTAAVAIYLCRPAPAPPDVEASRLAPSSADESIVEPETVPAEIRWDAAEPEAVELVDALEPTPLAAEPAEPLLLEMESIPAGVAFPANAFDVEPEETNLVDRSEAKEQVLHAAGRADKSLRNADFPRTYIGAIHVSLTSPDHWVELTWSGPQAARMEIGPFHGSPGAGLGYNDCNDEEESNRNSSNCTPKGAFAVAGFSDFLPSYPTCRFVTWFNIPRAVAFHSHSQVPSYPASHGCVRLDRHAAQLIHNNALIGKTEVTVDGTWSRQGRY